MNARNNEGDNIYISVKIWYVAFHVDISAVILLGREKEKIIGIEIPGLCQPLPTACDALNESAVIFALK